jgi:type I restriction enzyme M protein
MDDEDDFNFEERFAEQIKEEQRLNAFILENLAKIKMEK